MTIIEGPDGAGKTTLSTMLKNDRLIDKILESPARTRGTVPYYEQCIRYMKQWGHLHHVAVDRFMFSELVYGPILRGKSSISTKQNLWLLQEIISSGSIIIFCLPATLNFKPDESAYVIERIAHIKKAYEEWFETTSRLYPSGVFKYDWMAPDSYNQLLAKF